jgi:hypothetical protein
MTGQVYVLTAVGLVICFAGLVLLALTLRDAEALDTIAIYHGTAIVIGAVSGAVVLKEQDSNEAGRIVCYCLSLLLVVLALTLLAMREPASAPPGLRLSDRPISWPSLPPCTSVFTSSCTSVPMPCPSSERPPPPPKALVRRAKPAACSALGPENDRWIL